MKRYSVNANISLIVNFIYAIANCIIGFATYSWWFVTLGAYYSVLAVARFSVLRIKSKSVSDTSLEAFAKKITGILLLILSFCLVGIVTLSSLKDRGTNFHEIIMIAIATYTFTKITIAIISMAKVKGIASPAEKTLRNISLAEAVVSIYTLQRSMLVSFQGMAEKDMRLLNILTGTAVWLFVVLLGINLLGGRCVNMAKSKIVKANQKVASAVVDGYKKIEKGVVDGYKKIESAVTGGYTKIEDKFVDAYLTKDNETVEEAKARLKNKE